MSQHRICRWSIFAVSAVIVVTAIAIPAQQMVIDTRDPAQPQDEEFARLVKEWTTQPHFSSPLVDHLPKVPGVPSPKDVLGYHVGAPAKLTYYADALKYYRALAAALPARVKVETIGKSDEDRELVVVWVSSDENLRNLQRNRDNLAKIADPRGLSQDQVRQLISTTKPHYHLIGGLHSGETGPSEMLLELVYRLATETSPLVTQIRDNVIVSITPVADPDGRDRNVDWFYRNLEMQGSRGSEGPGGSAGSQTADVPTDAPGGQGQAGQGGGRGGAGGGVPYWGKYVYHDNNRDINLSQVSMRALAEWYFTAHPPIMHDLHESQPLLYTYSGAAPQNPNLDPILFAELPWFSNFELAQMTKWGMPGVYTHAFMDGWSPGYLGSIAYNHNGMMRMYETQAGREGGPSAGRGGRGRGGAPGESAPTPSTGSGQAPSTGSGQARSTGSGQAPSTGSGQAPSTGSGQAPSTGSGQALSTSSGQAPSTSPGLTGSGQTASTGAGQAPSAGSGQALSTSSGQGGRAGGPGVGRGQAASTVPTGRGGGQPREWYRGIPIPPGATDNWSRRNNTNYMQTGVLTGLQLTATFPNLIVENFYRKTLNSIEAGKTEPPHGFVIPVQRDMTRVAELVNILRIQRIEVGRASSEIKTADGTFPAGSYVIKRDQPYGRLAKNLLEKQNFPDPNLRTYDDSGWTMGLAMLVDVKEIKDKAILEAPATPVKSVALQGRVTGTGNAGLAVAHFGSNNMIAFRYRLRDVPMKIADKSFTAGGVEFPAGSFIVTPPADLGGVRAIVEQLGLTGAALSSVPAAATHDADVPRVAMFSSWTGTQEIGWVRFTFDKFGIPYDLIYKERVRIGNLRADYDVIVLPTQNLGRQAVYQPPAVRPVPYMKDAKYKFLGMYGESPDITGGMGGESVDAFARFLDAGGTLIAMGNAVRFPSELGLARTVDASGSTSAQFYAPRPLVQAEILRLDHPVFYGYTDKVMPIKYIQGQPLMSVADADRTSVLGRYVGGEASVLSGLMRGADEIRERAFAIDVPGGFTGKGRVVLFSNNPIYRWQNHGEFNMVFNAVLNWNDLAGAARPSTTTTTTVPGAGR